MVLSSAGSSSASTRIVLLAPSESVAPRVFDAIKMNRDRYTDLLAGMQKLRGRVYLEDGAIHRSQLTRDGRHKLSVDDSSWHVLLVDAQDTVLGCARYCSHELPTSFDNLGVRRSALAQSRVWGQAFRTAVDREIRYAMTRNMSYVEVGGWALSEALRFTGEALRIALSSFSLGRILGGCLGITTATLRNNSSRMLRRLGGRSLEVDGQELPHYFDRFYRCEMEILRFDSSNPNRRFEGLIDKLADELVQGEVICAKPRPATAKLPSLLLPAQYPVLGQGETVPLVR